MLYKCFRLDKPKLMKLSTLHARIHEFNTYESIFGPERLTESMSLECFSRNTAVYHFLAVIATETTSYPPLGGSL